VPILLGAALFTQLPDQIPIHFTFSGEADNYIPKIFAVFGLPIFLAILSFYSAYRIVNDPKVENASLRIRLALVWLIPLISNLFIPMSFYLSLGKEFPINLAGGLLGGIIIVFIGNYLPKCKRNYTVGIKLAWTLNDENNWNKTHRFAGSLWVAGGFAFMISAILNLNYIQVAILIVLIVVPIIYSWRHFQLNKC